MDGDQERHSPKTVSFVPAKSMVLTPRFCCWVWGAVKAVREATATAGLAAIAETNDRFCREGVVIFCLEAVRRVLANVLEAMLKVDRD